MTDAQVSERIQLADIHHVLAHEKGYSNWSELKRHDAALDRFLAAARGGALNAALAELRASPAIIEESIHVAAAIGNAEAVRHHLDAAPQLLHAEVDDGGLFFTRAHRPCIASANVTPRALWNVSNYSWTVGADPDTSSMRRALVAGNRSASLVLYKRGVNPASIGQGPETSFIQAFWGIPENPAPSSIRR